MNGTCYQVERIAAAGRTRRVAPAFVASIAGATGREWMGLPSTVNPTSKVHLTPAPRPEEAVP